MASAKQQKKGQTIAEVMTGEPICVESDTPVREAAQRMRDSDVGDVLVLENGVLCGIVTDRDIVVRCVAEDADPSEMEVGDLCSDELVTLAPSDLTADAVKLMKQKAVRRLPVVEGERAVGIVTLGDLAVAQDAQSALGRISAAPPNH